MYASVESYALVSSCVEQYTFPPWNSQPEAHSVPAAEAYGAPTAVAAAMHSASVSIMPAPGRQCWNVMPGWVVAGGGAGLYR